MEHRIWTSCLSLNPTLLGHKIDRVHILPSGQVIDTERKGTVGQQCQVVTGFNIERQIHTEIVGNTITVTVGIVNLHFLQTWSPVLPGRNCGGTARTVIHIERHAVTAGKLVIAYRLEVMRLVILGRIPFSTIDGTGYARIILTQESAQTKYKLIHPFSSRAV